MSQTTYTVGHLLFIDHINFKIFLHVPTIKYINFARAALPFSLAVKRLSKENLDLS